MTFTDARKACSSFIVALRSFVASWMSCHCALGGILEGWKLLGRFATGFSIWRQWLLLCFFLSPRAFKIAL